jgi:hypothetical protein
LAGAVAGSCELTRSCCGPLLMNRTCSVCMPTFAAHILRCSGLGLRIWICTQPRIGSECAREQDQAIQRRTRHEPGSVKCERVVDRGLTGVEVDGLNTRPLQLEHCVRRPQSRHEGVTHAVKTAHVIELNSVKTNGRPARRASIAGGSTDRAIPRVASSLRIRSTVGYCDEPGNAHAEFCGVAVTRLRSRITRSLCSRTTLAVRATNGTVRANAHRGSL